MGESSAAASITAGRDLLVVGASLQNIASNISAVRDATLSLSNFENKGYALGEYAVRGVYSPPSKFGEELLMRILAYNAVNDPSYGEGYASTGGDFRIFIISTRILMKSLSAGGHSWKREKWWAGLAPVLRYLRC